MIKNKEPKYFVIGAIVFASAHTLNLIMQIRFLPFFIDWYYYLIIGFGIGIVGIIAYIFRGNENPVMASVDGCYACFHILNIIFAVIMGIYRTDLDHFIAFILIGYILYVIINFIVNYVTNKHDINRRDFHIMLTYLLG